MPSNNGNSVKSKRILNFNSSDYPIPNGHGDDNFDDDNYLGPQFDSEILDLDEDITDDEAELHVNPKDIRTFNKKSIVGTNKEKSNSDICTVIGTNCFGKKIPYLIFSVEAVLRKDSNIRKIGERYNLSYKIYKTDCKLLKTILNSHGFLECQSYSNDYNLLWTGGHVKPFTLRTMSEHQKVNHFPRSYELTRKDRLFKNIQKMQQLKGLKHFDFVPPSYLIPSEFQELCQNFSKEKNTYIIKPIALSRGRGIFLSNHPGQIPLDEQLIASKYISNPYLINELKFDIRMYVLVTSYDPLVAYLYEEGLTRFATVKYQNTPKNLKTQCMHLTNYSVNKKNNEFIHNDDADVEDFGNKWSLGALLRYLKSKNVDTTCLMMKIEDIIVKSLISVEAPISATSRMFQTYRSNCFELYGYDIIIDENLRPWLLEVNLSPSLSCDSPLDFKIKSHMMSDMFSLIGIGCEDPVLNNPNQPYLNSKVRSSNYSQSTTDNKIPKQINNQNSSIRRPTAGLRRRDLSTSSTPFRSDQLRMIRRVREEYKRKGGWIRIFPTSESLETYFPLFQSQNSEQNNCNNSTHTYMNLNRLLHSKLFPNHIIDIDNFARSISQNQAIIKSRISLHSVNYNSSYHKDPFNQTLPTNQGTYKRISQNYSDTQTRIPYYERKLGEEPQLRNQPEKSSFQDPIETAKNSNPIENNFHDSDNEMLSSSSSISLSDKDNNSVDNSDSEIDDYDEEHTSTASHNIPSSMSQSSKEILSVDRIVQSGGKLTKIQARMAFSNYLSRVQRRLLLECRSEESHSLSDKESNSHEQIELVIRFLKRAATNMSANEFEIPTIPSRSQPLYQRQEWLAKLLGNFIRIYSRETSLAATAKEIENPAIIDKKSFLCFLRVASENDLEITLSNYTRVNKSAGIFLNPNLNTKNPEPTTDDSIRHHHLPAPPPPPPTAGLHKSVSMSNLTLKEKTSYESFQKPQKPIYKPLANKTQSSLQINQKQTIPVENYSNGTRRQSFSRPSSVNQTIPWRPGSTKLSTNNTNNNANNPRPLTSNAITNRNNKIISKQEKSYDPDAISKALQRLTTDQRNRQLTASVFSFYDSDFEPLNQNPKSSNLDPLAQTLIRQYQQSKRLLQESRAKHNALLSQNSNSDLMSAGMIPKTVNLTNKPPPGIRTSQSAKFSCPPKK